MTNRSNRFDVTMNKELAEQFNKLADDTDLSRPEVFRRAIGLYKRVIENHLDGGNLLLKKPDGSIVEVVGLINRNY